jgi:hypothetical protein
MPADPKQAEITYELVVAEDPYVTPEGPRLTVVAHVKCREHDKEWTEAVAVILNPLGVNPLVKIERPFGVCGLYRFLDQFRDWREARGASNKTMDAARRW